MQCRCKPEVFSENRKASYENRKISHEDAESSLQKALALYVPKFLKNGAVSLTDPPELRLGFP